MTLFQLTPAQQRRVFLVASGVSTAGSFAGITAKGWILMDGSSQPFVLALNFAGDRIRAHFDVREVSL